MKIIKTVKTPIAEISVLENKLIFIDIIEPFLQDMAVFHHHSQIIEETFGLSGLYAITRTVNIKRVSTEIRKFGASPEVLKFAKASALLVSSGVSRIAGNLYLTFNKPAIPTKLFTNFEKAEVWLLGERAKDLASNQNE